MKRTALLVTALLFTAGAATAQSLAFTGVTVIDVEEGVAEHGMIVVTRGDRIAAVGDGDAVELPSDATVIDGSGKHLIPGLWDMHTHLLWSTDASEHLWTDMPTDVDAWTLWERYYGPTLDLLVANGVTGIREMWGNLEVVRRVREEAAAGERLAPRMVVAGHHVDGHPPSYPGQVVATTPAEGRTAVDSLKTAGAAFIKTYSHLDPDVFFAIVERAEERGLPVASHVPIQVSAGAASEAGQRSFEHLIGVVQGCSAQEDHLIRLSRRQIEAARREDRERVTELDREWRERVLATQDSGRCRALLETLARNRTWQVPTLVNNRARAYRNDRSFTDDPRLKYIPPARRDSWLPRSDPHLVKVAEEFQLLRRHYERKLEITGMAAEEGVPILAGTDTPNPFVFPGFGLHDELELLVEAGLTPLQALQAATLNPARYLEATDSLGTVEAGKLADLVLLDANPLEDITNTQRIRAVVADGRLYRRADLDRILAEVEAMHRESERQEPSGPSGTGSALQEVVPLAVPNDNRSPAGALRDGVLEVELEARLARWEGEESALAPDAPDPSIVTVLAFAEPGGPARIPGPLIRVPQGTEVRVRVRNLIPDSVSIGLPGPGLREPGMSSLADSVLVVGGLRAGTAPDDTLHVARGQAREVRYRADRPGTYLYWATPSKRSIGTWTGRDAQLAGAIVVDPAGATPDPDERIFVITMLDQFPDSTRPSPRDDLFRRAINGLSWPDTERFHYAIGDTVRWRWVNASSESHPMHLHGFHYRVLARGDGTADTVLASDERPLVVTEHMTPGSTFRMEWVPARAGNWIFHCHILDHITPTGERDEEALAADLHDVERHALEAMGGLVLGMTISEDGPPSLDDPPRQRLRLLAQERRLDDERWRRGFVLQEGAEPPSDSASAPGPPLLLTRGETTEITVVNRLTEPTTIHWHGLELESVFDGVAGWSRTGPRIAPLIAPGDSFAVRITPPRAGTFIYHTHMDATDQLAQGMIGPFLVLEPGEAFDPESDRVFTIGGQTDGPYPVNINGHTDPPPVTFRAGREYRLRLIHISRGATLRLSLVRGGGTPVRWRAVAKDGADLPPALQVEGPAELRTQTGETFDFLWTPEQRGEATLVLRYEPFFSKEERVVTQTFRVR